MNITFWKVLRKWVTKHQYQPFDFVANYPSLETSVRVRIVRHRCDGCGHYIYTQDQYAYLLAFLTVADAWCPTNHGPKIGVIQWVRNRVDCIMPSILIRPERPLTDKPKPKEVR